jgi:hypothetical protein
MATSSFATSRSAIDMPAPAREAPQCRSEASILGCEHTPSVQTATRAGANFLEIEAMS